MRYLKAFVKTLAVIDAVLIFYWFLKLNIFDGAVLNRFGILLNLLAGFLVAPELLGPEGLKRVEQNIPILHRAFRGAVFKDATDPDQRSRFMREMLVWTVVSVLVATPTFALLLRWYDASDNLTGFLMMSVGVSMNFAVIMLVSEYLSVVVHELRRSANIRHILVRWGIVCFVFGNLFQFLGTF